MQLWHALFPRRDFYRPSPTVEHRIDGSSFDVDELTEVLSFVIIAIREERMRLAAARAHAQSDRMDETKVPLIWPEAA